MNLETNLANQRIQHYEEVQNKKMDILFYDSVQKVKSLHRNSAIYQMIKALIFIIFIPIDYAVIKSPNDDKILAAMIIALVTSLLQSFSEMLYRCISLRNIPLLLRICRQMGHNSQQPVTNLTSLQNCVSQTLYNRPNQTLVNSQGLTTQIKKMYTTILSTQIQQLVKRQEQCLKQIDQLMGFLGFASMVYAIIALAISEKNTAQLTLLIIYIVLEGFSKFLIILIILLISLAPILCCLFICCACCCSGDRGGGYQLPDVQKATQQMITQADGTCSICYQNFLVGSDVIRLKCSPKHMYHPLCIQGWAKLRATCPICRASLGDDVNRSAPI